MNFSIVINNLVMIFLMIAVGFVTGRQKLVSEKAQADLTSLVLNITLPCTILGSMIREFDSALARDSILIFLLGMLFFGGFMIINCKIAGLFKVSAERQPVWVLSTALCNIGFMGFPLIRAIFGEDGLFLAAMMNVAYNTVSWSLGVKIISGQGKGSKTNWKKILISRCNFAVALGLIFFLGQIPFPATILSVINSFGAVTTPVSMFLIGLSLAGGSVLDVFRDRDAYSITLMRLIIIPLITVVILKLLPIPEGSLLPGVVTLIMAMPGPSFAMMMAQQYGKDTALAARAIFMTSLFCIVTIPLILLTI